MEKREEPKISQEIDRERLEILHVQYCKSIFNALFGFGAKDRVRTFLSKLNDCIKIQRVQTIESNQLLAKIRELIEQENPDVESLCNLVSDILAKLHIEIEKMSLEKSSNLQQLIPYDPIMTSSLEILDHNLLSTLLSMLSLEDLLNLRFAMMNEKKMKIVSDIDIYLNKMLKTKDKDKDETDQLCAVLLSRFFFYLSLIPSYQKWEDFSDKKLYKIIKPKIILQLVTKGDMENEELSFDIFKTQFRITSERFIPDITDVKTLLNDNHFTYEMNNDSLFGKPMDARQINSLGNENVELIQEIQETIQYSGTTSKHKKIKDLKYEYYDQLRKDVDIFLTLSSKQKKPLDLGFQFSKLGLPDSLDFFIRPYILTGDEFYDKKIISFILKETNELKGLTNRIDDIEALRKGSGGRKYDPFNLEKCRDFVKQQVTIQIMMKDIIRVLSFPCFKSSVRHLSNVTTFSEFRKYTFEFGRLALDIHEPELYKKLRVELFDTPGAACFTPISAFVDETSKGEYLMNTLMSFFIVTLPKMKFLLDLFGSSSKKQKYNGAEYFSLWIAPKDKKSKS